MNDHPVVVHKADEGLSDILDMATRAANLDTVLGILNDIATYEEQIKVLRSSTTKSKSKQEKNLQMVIELGGRIAYCKKAIAKIQAKFGDGGFSDV